VLNKILRPLLETQTQNAGEVVLHHEVAISTPDRPGSLCCQCVTA